MDTSHLTDMLERLGPLDADWICDEFDDSWGDALSYLLEELGYSVLGNGHFGVAIEGSEVELPTNTVVKLCASEDDSYPIWIEYCARNPHPTLPRVYDYGWAASGIFWCILPRYEHVSRDEFEAVWHGWSPGGFDRCQHWRSILDDFEGLADIDIHAGNIMRDPEGEYILTDPLGYLTPDTCLDDARHTLSNRGLI